MPGDRGIIWNTNGTGYPDEDYQNGELVDNRSQNRIYNRIKSATGNSGSYVRGEPDTFTYPNEVYWEKTPTTTVVEGTSSPDGFYRGMTLIKNDGTKNPRIHEGDGILYAGRQLTEDMTDDEQREALFGGHQLGWYEDDDGYWRSPVKKHDNDNQNYRSAYKRVYKSGGRGSKK